jgi:hypothetical protein
VKFRSARRTLKRHDNRRAVTNPFMVTGPFTISLKSKLKQAGCLAAGRESRAP